MTKITLFLLILLSFGCTKQHGQLSVAQKEIPVDVVSVEELSESVIVDSAKKTGQSSADLLAFEDVSPNQIKRLRTYLKNNLSDDLALSFTELSTALSGSAFSLIKNTCPAILSPSKVCYFDLQLDHSDVLSYDNVSFKLFSDETNTLFGSFVISGSKAVITPNKSISFTKLGQFDTMSVNQQIRIYLKNTGDIVYNPQLTVPAEYEIAKSTCIGTLKTNKACYIDLKIKATIDPEITGVNKEIVYDGSSLAITAGVGAPLNNISCGASYTNVAGACEQTNQIRACTTQPANSINGYEETFNGGVDWNACQAYDCIATHTNIAGSCVLTNQTQSCPILNGTGSQDSTDGGQSFNLCTVVSCNPTYTNVSNSCVLTNQSQACSIANGTGSQNSTDGGVTWGACNVVSCNQDYSILGNACIYGIAASGGEVSYVDASGLNPRTSGPYAGGYTIRKFTSSGSLSISAGSTSIEALIVGGGAGGRGCNGGGGGAGQVKTLSNTVISAGTYAITIGSGGNGGNGGACNVSPQGGGSTVAFGQTSLGGDPGGSSGGASGSGFSGGNGGGAQSLGSGGGAGSFGAGGSYSGGSGGSGGPGLTSSITGLSLGYAGGGGGAGSNSGGSGGSGSHGGGNGGNGGGMNNGGSAAANTGSGGGGGAGQSGVGNAAGGSGAAGVVIIKYRNE